MAIFHLSFKVLTRTTKTGKSKSSLYLAAYNSREKLKDELTGLTFDYTKKNDLYKSGIILPEEAPARFYDRATLWQNCEAAESRRDSQEITGFFFFVKRLKNRHKQKHPLKHVEPSQVSPLSPYVARLSFLLAPFKLSNFCAFSHFGM